MHDDSLSYVRSWCVRPHDADRQGLPAPNLPIDCHRIESLLQVLIPPGRIAGGRIGDCNRTDRLMKDCP